MAVVVVSGSYVSDESRRCRFVGLDFIFVYWTLNLSLSSSRYCTVPAPGRHGAGHSRSVSLSYFTYRNRIVELEPEVESGERDAGGGGESGGRVVRDRRAEPPVPVA